MPALASNVQGEAVQHETHDSVSTLVRIMHFDRNNENLILRGKPKTQLFVGA